MLQDKAKKMDELDDLIGTLKEQRELFKQERTQDKE